MRYERNGYYYTFGNRYSVKLYQLYMFGNGIGNAHPILNFFSYTNHVQIKTQKKVVMYYYVLLWNRIKVMVITFGRTSAKKNELKTPYKSTTEGWGLKMDFNS